LIATYDTIYAILTNADLGAFASMVGACLTIAVFVSVEKIRKRVLFKLRAPEAIKDLTDRATKVSNAMQDFDASLPLIEQELALANETLKNIASKVSGDVKKTIKSAMRAIAEFRDLPVHRKKRDVTRSVYLHLLISTKAIENLIADVREEP